MYKNLVATVCASAPAVREIELARLLLAYGALAQAL